MRRALAMVDDVMMVTSPNLRGCHMGLTLGFHMHVICLYHIIIIISYKLRFFRPIRCAGGGHPERHTHTVAE